MDTKNKTTLVIMAAGMGSRFMTARLMAMKAPKYNIFSISNCIFCLMLTNEIRVLSI